MSAKDTLLKVQILTAVNGATNQVSEVVPIRFLDNIGVQANMTGTNSLTGTLTIQVSADYLQDTEGNVLVVGNWINLTAASVASGQPAQTYFDLNQLSAPWLRLTWTAISGTGTIDAFATAKRI